MVKPIEATPKLSGKDAEDFLRAANNPNYDEAKTEFLEKAKKAYEKYFPCQECARLRASLEHERKLSEKNLPSTTKMLNEELAQARAELSATKTTLQDTKDMLETRTEGRNRWREEAKSERARQDELEKKVETMREWIEKADDDNMRHADSGGDWSFGDLSLKYEEVFGRAGENAGVAQQREGRDRRIAHVGANPTSRINGRAGEKK